MTSIPIRTCDPVEAAHYEQCDAQPGDGSRSNGDHCLVCSSRLVNGGTKNRPTRTCSPRFYTNGTITFALFFFFLFLSASGTWWRWFTSTDIDIVWPWCPSDDVKPRGGYRWNITPDRVTCHFPMGKCRRACQSNMNPGALLSVVRSRRDRSSQLPNKIYANLSTSPLVNEKRATIRLFMTRCRHIGSKKRDLPSEFSELFGRFTKFHAIAFQVEWAYQK